MKAIFASLVDDWIRFRWRDTVALVLIFGGVGFMAYSKNSLVTDAGKGLMSAGLIMLDPRAMLRGSSPGENGSMTTTVTEKTTATLPVQTSANQSPPAPPAGWPAK
jgi:hypothetical protein